MPHVMPEIMLQKAIQVGITNLRNDDAAFNQIFCQYLDPLLVADYGQAYIDKIRVWFKTTNIPVLQPWSLNAQRIPCYSIHLTNEVEDETKAAAGDYMGMEDDLSSSVGVSVFSTMVDIGIHANRASDEVLWLYYILSYILFKEKLLIDRLGMQLTTFSASDYTKVEIKMTENIFTRWIRFKCTVQNFWGQEDTIEPQEVDLTVEGSRVGDPDDDELVVISQD